MEVSFPQERKHSIEGYWCLRFNKKPNLYPESLFWSGNEQYRSNQYKMCTWSSSSFKSSNVVSFFYSILMSGGGEFPIHLPDVEMDA
jgi:hypothetical protein